MKKDFLDTVSHFQSKNTIKRDIVHLLFKFFVIVYVLVVLLAGITLLLTLLIVDRIQSKQIAPIEQALFSFLYSVSCAWMLFILIHSSIEKKKHRYCLICNNCTQSQNISIYDNNDHEDSDKNEDVFSNQSLIENASLKQSNKYKQTLKYINHIQSLNYMYDQQSSNKSSLFFHVGLGMFCLGNAMHYCLKLIRNFNNHKCDELIGVVDITLNIVFSIFQYFFFFKRSNIVIQCNSHFALMGSMHIMTTNLLVWIKNIALETRAELLHDDPECLSLFNQSTQIESLDTNNSTRNFAVMNKYINLLITTLYPFSIEYSLMCLSLMFFIVKSIRHKSRKSLVKQSDFYRYLPKNKSQYKVDCTGSIKGLFFGIVVIILTLLSLCIFTMLKNTRLNQSILLLSYSTTSGLNILSLTSSIILLYLVKNIRLKQNVDKLSINMLVLAMAGVFLYCLFSLMPIYYIGVRHSKLLSFRFSMITLELIVCSVHGFLVYVLLSSHIQNIVRVPTRAIILFLVICDILLWLDENTAATKSIVNPYKTFLYKDISWTVIKAFSAPLKIFFQIHCAFCLSDCWAEIT